MGLRKSKTRKRRLEVIKKGIDDRKEIIIKEGSTDRGCERVSNGNPSKSLKIWGKENAKIYQKASK